MYESEQSRRQAVELMASSSRQLSLLSKMEDVPQQILEQLNSIVQFDRGIVCLEDVNGVPEIAAHRGLPPNAPLSELCYAAQTGNKITDMYHAVARHERTDLHRRCHKDAGLVSTCLASHGSLMAGTAAFL